MRRIALASVLLGAACLAGCLPSFHPVYTERELVAEEKLVGTWRHEDGTTLAFQSKGVGAFSLVMTDKDGEQPLVAHLADIGGLRLVDYTPDLKRRGLQESHVVSMHGWCRVVGVDAQHLRIAHPDVEWIAQHLEEHPRALRHEKREPDDVLLLTASTSELQDFIRKHAARLFGEVDTLARVP